MAKKKKQEPGSKIDGLPYHSDICNFVSDNSKKRRDFKAGKSEDTNFFEDLTPFDVLLLHTLLSGMNPKNKSNWRNQETLALEMGCSIKTVERSGKQLAKFTLIEITKIGRKGGGYGGYRYRIIYPWKPEYNSKSQIKSDRESEIKSDRESEIKSDRESEIHPTESRKSNPTESRTNISNQNKSKKVNKQSSTIRIVDPGFTTFKSNTVTVDPEDKKLKNGFEFEPEEPEDENLKYGFEIENDESRKLKIFEWYSYVCRKNENLEPQVEKHIKDRGSGAIYDPGAFRTYILKRLRAGEEEDFWYVSPQEIAEEVRLLREQTEALNAYNKEKRRLRGIRLEKIAEALKLFEALPHEDMEEVGLSMDSFHKKKQREDFLIGMIPEMQKILTKNIN